MLLACQRSDQPAPAATASAPDTIALRAAIRARADGFAAAVVSGNADSIADYMASDVVLLEPGLDIRSRDAFRTLLLDMSKTTTIASFVVTPEAHAYGTDHVTEFGRYREVYRDKKSGTETICDCLYVTLWRKDSAGIWRQSRVHAGQRVQP